MRCSTPPGSASSNSIGAGGSWRPLDRLRTGDALFDEGGLLRARSSADHADLQRLLRRVLPPIGTPRAGGSMTVRRSAGLPPLVLHVTPVGGQEPLLDDSEAAGALWVGTRGTLL